ncbi:hypothetical protein [Variovorax paradoxus]|uniref:hypothetical protein n=1 Tax=Variovorax paradoxus TaxID=34073 RepID=UPI002788CDE2|nr:hypothetical protein [Variovorax paradoxus]MDP9932531.1 phosphoglycerol transferase MdoB-like AlkP superfamily enzyme [Variovorax paradoxus]
MPAFFWMMVALLCFSWVGIWMELSFGADSRTRAPIYVMLYTGGLMAYWFKRTGRGGGWGFLAGLLLGVAMFTLLAVVVGAVRGYTAGLTLPQQVAPGNAPRQQ